MVVEMKSKLDKLSKDSEEQVHSKSWVKSFFSGYCVSIGERIKESKAKVINELESTGTSVALVLRDKEHAMEDFWQKQERKPASVRKLTTVSGYYHGIDSGKSADLQQNKLGK
jgi:hypothetical protein